jgi:hypothetical protein
MFELSPSLYCHAAMLTLIYFLFSVQKGFAEQSFAMVRDTKKTHFILFSSKLFLKQTT